MKQCPAAFAAASAASVSGSARAVAPGGRGASCHPSTADANSCSGGWKHAALRRSYK